MKNFFKKNNFKVIGAIFLVAALWGGGRGYFYLTDGYLESNMTSDFAYNPALETRALNDDESKELAMVLDQPFKYLSKGCQSYVFETTDRRYVVKFFKYQRFRPQAWLDALSFLPPVKKHIDEKQVKKLAKLGFFMKAWKIAFDDLKEESGLVAVHLNKTKHLKKDFILKDKIGFTHVLPADDLEFLIQRKADKLTTWIDKRSVGDSKELITNLVDMIVSEYKRGLADNDHALMQNTGVYLDKPFHMDVGQFTKDAKYLDPKVWHQELYNKMYEFRLWLFKKHPELAEHLTLKLKEVIGDDYHKMTPFFGRIHN